MENHARIICNQGNMFQCSDDNTLTSSGYQLVIIKGNMVGETKFVCKDCFLKYRNKFPVLGKPLKELVSTELLFSGEYDPEKVETTETETDCSNDGGYVGELIQDGDGWRVPTLEELEAMRRAELNSGISENKDEDHSIEVRYRFTTDNKLLVILPKKCRIDDETYELVVTTE